jgi:hypothetical protein
VIAAVLFARRDSIYKTFEGLDVYDFERNALNFGGGLPVIAHPPCRAWGELSHMAKPRKGEKELAFFAAEMVRKNGGVLEHPKKSKLWAALKCLAPGQIDNFGGWLLPINQSCFGHRAEKKTYLYIVGVSPSKIPDLPLYLGRASHVIASSGCRVNGRKLKKGDLNWRPEVTKNERERTPAELANWLVDLVKGINRD